MLQKIVWIVTDTVNTGPHKVTATLILATWDPTAKEAVESALGGWDYLYSFCYIVLIRNLGSNEALSIPSIGNSVDYNCLFCANSSTLINKRICFKNINNEVKW